MLLLLLLLLLLADDVVVDLKGTGDSHVAGAGAVPAARVEFGRAGKGDGGLFELDEALFLLRAETAEEGACG